MTVYGPYTRKDGRQIVIHYKNGKRTTQSYPRYLMEKHLGRKLKKSEEVDHDDKDITNNNISNLKLLSKRANILRSIKPAVRIMFKCPTCLKQFKGLQRQYKSNQLKQKKRGPYCSKSCAGKAGRKSV